MSILGLPFLWSPPKSLRAIGFVGRGAAAPPNQAPQMPKARNLKFELPDHLRDFAFHLLCPVSFLCSFISASPPDKNHTSGLVAIFKLPLGEFQVMSFLETYSQAKMELPLPKLFPPHGKPFLQAYILPCPSRLSSTGPSPLGSFSDSLGLGREPTVFCTGPPSLSLGSLVCIICILLPLRPGLGTLWRAKPILEPQPHPV